MRNTEIVWLGRFGEKTSVRRCVNRTAGVRAAATTGDRRLSTQPRHENSRHTQIGYSQGNIKHKNQGKMPLTLLHQYHPTTNIIAIQNGLSLHKYSLFNTEHFLFHPRKYCTDIITIDNS